MLAFDDDGIQVDIATKPKEAQVDRTAYEGHEPEMRALLDTIAGNESPGYDVMYSGSGRLRRFDDFSDHPRSPDRITRGPNAGKTSAAAGRYQHTPETWDRQASKLDLQDFGPENQDISAADLAETTYGSGLLDALKTDDPRRLSGVARKLSGQWTSLPGGIESTMSDGDFIESYRQNLAKYKSQSAAGKNVGFTDDQLAPIDQPETTAIAEPAPAIAVKKPSVLDRGLSAVASALPEWQSADKFQLHPPAKEKGPAVDPDYKALEDSLQTTLAPQYVEAVRNAYEAATPEKRQQLMAAPGELGAVASYIDKKYQASNGVMSSDPALQATGERREDVVLRNKLNGMDQKSADVMADREVQFDAQPITGQAQSTDFNFERANELRKAGPVRRGAEQGVDDLKRQAAGLHFMAADFADSMGIPSAAGYARAQEKARGKLSLREQEMGEAPNEFDRHVESAIRSTISNAPTMAAAVLTGSEAIPLMGMGLQVAGDEYAHGIEQGLSRENSTKRSVLMGAAEILGEKYGLTDQVGVLKKFFGGDMHGFATLFAKNLREQILGEEVTTIAQWRIDKDKKIGLNQDSTGADLLKQMQDTLYQTVIQTAIMGAPGAAHAVAGNIKNRDRRLQASTDTLESVLRTKIETLTQDPEFVSIMRNETDPNMGGIDRAKQARQILAERRALSDVRSEEISPPGITGEPNAQSTDVGNQGNDVPAAGEETQSQKPSASGTQQDLATEDRQAKSQVGPYRMQPFDGGINIIDGNDSIVSAHKSYSDAVEAFDQLNAASTQENPNELQTSPSSVSEGTGNQSLPGSGQQATEGTEQGTGQEAQQERHHGLTADKATGLDLPAQGQGNLGNSNSSESTLTARQESELRGHNLVLKKLGKPEMTAEQFLAEESAKLRPAASNRSSSDQDVIDAYNRAVDTHNATLNAGGASASGSLRRARVKVTTAMPSGGLLQRRTAESIAKVFGHKVIFVESEDGRTLDIDGSIVGSHPNHIILAADSRQQLSRVAVHEMVHGLRRNAPEIYAQLVRNLRENYNPLAVAKHLAERNYDSALPSVNDNPEQFSPENRNEEEWVSDHVSDIIHRPEAVKQLAERMEGQKKGSGQAFLQHVKDFIDSLITKLRGEGFGTEAALTSKSLKKSRDAVVEALAAYQQKQSDKVAEKAENNSKNAEAAYSNRQAEESSDVQRLHMVAQRNERETGKQLRLSDLEKNRIAESAESHGIKEKTIVDAVRQHKLAHPLAQGWGQLTYKRSVKNDVGKLTHEYEITPYSFSSDAAGKQLSPGTPAYEVRVKKVAAGMVAEVKDIFTRANAGDQNAKNILAQAGWYKAMRSRLRSEFGGLGDLFADLLGATSPNTPVRENWKNAVDVLRRATRGDFDDLMPRWIERYARIDDLESRLRGLFNDRIEAGLTKKAIKALPEYVALKKEISEAKEFPKDLLPKKESGALYGFNGRNVTRALADLWRVVRNADPDIGRGGTAPKALNFSGNLIGFRERATIDVWAARMLQRLAGMPRIPSMAESGVSGEMRESGETTLQFGFGQDVFNRATNLIRKDPQLSKDSNLAGINDDDLQAVVWFIEKELWTKNNWTSVAGEGGSFELEASLTGSKEQPEIRRLRKIIDSTLSTPEAKEKAKVELAKHERTADRYIGGMSVEQSEEIQGKNFIPSDAEMNKLSKEISAAIHAGSDGSSVLGAKVVSTKGMYGKGIRAFDIEAVTTEGFDPNPLWLDMLKKARDAKQESVFLSRILRPDESVDYTTHRPGIEIYFREMVSKEKLDGVLSELKSKGAEFFTVVTDGRRMPSALQGEMPPAVGIRMQYIPEFEHRYGLDDLSGMTDQGMTRKIEEKWSELNDLTYNALSDVPNISFAGVFWYETRVAFSHEYEALINGYSARNSEERVGSTGSQGWKGQSIGSGIKSANRQLRKAEVGKPDGQQSVPFSGNDIPASNRRDESFKRDAVHRARRGSNGSVQGESGSYLREGRIDGKSVRVLGTSRVSIAATWRPSKSTLDAFNDASMKAPSFFELRRGSLTNADAFSAAITNSKNSSPFGAAVYVYPTSDYRKMKLFLSEDGRSGVAVKNDGDVVSVFGSGGTGDALMQLAVSSGGKKLDAFDTVLPKLYSRHGFVAVARTPWNDEYAPDGWSKETFNDFDGGEPDVVFMVYKPDHFGLYTKQDGTKFTGDDGYDRAVEAQEKALAFPDIPASNRQTDTPEFKRWFGDSKVVDESGKPLVVYHGTRPGNDIRKFREKKHDGIYFTPDPGYAEGFTNELFTDSGDIGAIYPVYLSIKNPHVVQADPESKEWEDFVYHALDKQELIAKGHDGAILKYPDGEIDQVMAFHSNQIKSAIGNNGEFSPTNSDIRYSNRKNVMDQKVTATWRTPGEHVLDDLIYTMQDKLVDTKRVQQAIERANRTVEDEWNPYQKEMLYHGRSAKLTQDFLVNEIKPLFKAMTDEGITMGELETFLWNRHAQERNAQIRSINASMPDGGSGITDQDAQDYLNSLTSDQRDKFDSLAKMVDKITEGTRKLLVTSGLETQDTVLDWQNTYQNYVPLQRADVEGSKGRLGTGQGFSIKGTSTKRAMGSDKKVVDILANLMMQRERTIVRAEKNRVALALYGLAIQNENPGFWLPVNPEAMRAPVKTMTELMNLGLNSLDFDGLMKEPTVRVINPKTGLVESVINPVLRNRDNVLAVRINGKDRFLFFNQDDPRAIRMVESLKNLDADQIGTILSGFRMVTRWFASINTQFNPIFGIVNLTRDVGGGAINLTSTQIAGKEARVLMNIAPAIAGIYKDLRADRSGKSRSGSAWSRLWEEFQEVGGKTGYRDLYMTSDDRAKALQKEINAIYEGAPKKFFKGIFNWLSDYNETLENGVRLAAYKVARDQGMSKDQAAALAKNLTVNFNKKGQIAQQAGALYAFFNANIQGNVRLAETLRGPSGKKIILGGFLLGAAQAVLLSAAGYDDDEPPDFVRERNLIIPIGRGNFFNIPLPLGLHLIPNTGRVVTQIALNKGEGAAHLLVGLLGSYVDAFDPMGSSGFSVQTLTPTLIDPLAALSENRDSFGKEIAKEDRSNLNPTPGFHRAKDTASKFSKIVSEGVNWVSGGNQYVPGELSPTPDQIDFLIGQVTGGVGREALKIDQTVRSLVSGEELPPHKIPLVGRFYGTTQSQSAESGKFYSNLTMLNKHEAQMKGMAEEGKDVDAYVQKNPEAALAQAANAVEQTLTKLKTTKRLMLSKGADRSEIKSIEREITSLMRDFNNSVKESREAPNDRRP